MNTHHHPLSPHHTHSPVLVADLALFAYLVPPSGAVLLRLLGVTAGLALINGLGGVQVLVPKGPCNNAGGARVWGYLARVIGVDAMLVLAREMGGEGLEVPTLDSLRKERRNAAMRAQFDQMTAREPAGQALSKARAVQELCLLHRPITHRQIESILDRATYAPDLQNQLF